MPPVHWIQGPLPPSDPSRTPPVHSAIMIKALPVPVQVQLADSTQSMTAQQTRAYSKGTILGRLGSAPSVHQSSNGKDFYMYVSCLALTRDADTGRDAGLMRYSRVSL